MISTYWDPLSFKEKGEKQGQRQKLSKEQCILERVAFYFLLDTEIPISIRFSYPEDIVAVTDAVVDSHQVECARYHNLWSGCKCPFLYV